MKAKVSEIFNFRNCTTLAFINFMFAFFVDSMLIYKHFDINHLESYFHIVIVNVAFIVFTVLSIVKRKECEIKIDKDFTKHLPMCLLIIIVTVLAIIKYDTVAIYDAHLYYGSFITAFKVFDFTIASTIGSFNLWGHEFIGTALFVAPFESLAFGKMVGTYVANTILFDVSLIILYKLLNDFMVKSNTIVNTFLVAIFAFMPYSFSLITYFNPDFYLSLYLIWLMYAYKKDNQLMVSFIGFILCFTKGSGSFLYGFFALSMFVFQGMQRYKKEKFEWYRIKNWPFFKFIIWLLPAILYAFAFLTKEKFLLQTFPAGGSLTFGLKAYDISIQNMQTFILGFRWLILVLFALAIIVRIFAFASAKKKSKKLAPVIDLSLLPQFFSILVTCFLYDVLLSVFTLSHCPRYTNPMNLMFVMMLAIAVYILANKDVIRGIISCVIAMLFIAQTYVTIDPVIKGYCTGIDTGNKIIYNLGGKKYEDAGFFNDLIGDYSVYNEEYTFTSNLVDSILSYVNPQTDLTVMIYDTYYYEYHFGGLQYRIYWDTKELKQVYEPNENTIMIYDGTVSSAEPVGEYPGFDLLLVVPGRKSEAAALQRYLNERYSIVDIYNASNPYGSASLYQLRLVNE